MKSSIKTLFTVLAISASSIYALAQGTAFTYQGRLFDNTNPSNGSYALKFTLYPDATTGMPALTGPVIVAPVAVSNGLFTVTIDFGSSPNPFTGPLRWLQIDSASNSASPIFIPLTPRQQLTPAPYAIFAATASNLSGTLPTAQLSGTVLNDQLANNDIILNPGPGLSGGGAVALGGSTSLAIPSAGVINSMLANPMLTVTAGTGLSGGGSVALGGSTTLNNTGVLSVAGNSDITATNVSGTVTLGDTATSANTPNTIVKRDGTGNISVGTVTGNGSGLVNVDAATVNGLTANSLWQTTGNAGTTPEVNFLGTIDNQALEFRANDKRALRLEPDVNLMTAPNVIGGSSSNMVDAGVSDATIAGGGAYFILVNPFRQVFNQNRVSANFGAIGGGDDNWIQAGAYNSVITGGLGNTVGAAGAIVAGGISNTNQAGNSVISGGFGNEILANASESTVSGGYSNVIQAGAAGSTIAGGQGNLVQDDPESDAEIGGAIFSTIGGGSANSIAFAGSSTISGGYQDKIDGVSLGSTIGGGTFNHINNATGSTIGGGFFNYITDPTSTEKFDASIGGGAFNNIFDNALNATIAGGSSNTINANAAFATIGGGEQNVIFDDSTNATIAGGFQNAINASAVSATIAGGYLNTIGGSALGPKGNWASVGGGYGNSASGDYGTIPGGNLNSVAGEWSFAAGNRAKANENGKFVWADAENADFTGSTFIEVSGAGGTNSVNFRCRGGFWIYSGNQSMWWAAGQGGWNVNSDRNLKDRFTAVNAQSVLEKLARLPLSEWSYKNYPQRHIGVMAQDFHAAFPFNGDDKTINELDLHGVTLAAIQGLNQKLEADAKEKETRIVQLEAEVSELKSAQRETMAKWEARFRALQKTITHVTYRPENLPTADITEPDEK